MRKYVMQAEERFPIHIFYKNNRSNPQESIVMNLQIYTHWLFRSFW